MPLQISEGLTVPLTLGGTVAAGAIVALNDVAGVLVLGGVSGDVRPVALEGVFEVAKKAGATLDFAVGEKVQSLSTGGVLKAVATGGALPLGIAYEAAVTGATTVKVKLCTW